MVIVSIAAIILLIYACLIFIYKKEWNALPYYTPSVQKREFISVIIPARNEENNLPGLISALASQHYPPEYFEIILVDDYSTDKTKEIALNSGLNNFKVIQPSINENNSSKKKAIESGIAIARGEIIVTTDADCLPGKLWLELINNFFLEKKASFVAAPVKFQNDNSFLQLFQSLDFIILQGITAASVSSGLHDMCNGANLAYKKQSFNAVNGFEGIDSVATGDDILLMYKIRQAEPGNIFYLKNHDAVMVTQPMKSWKDFFMQRRRWASKTFIYHDKRIIAILALVYLVNLFFIVILLASIFAIHYLWLAMGYLILKALIEFPFVHQLTSFYNEKKLRGYFFLFQPFHVVYTVIAGTLSQFGKYEWKGRKTK